MQKLSHVQELELLSALDSRAESPTKFMYLGEGYAKWIRIAEMSRDKKAVQFEEDKLKTEFLPFVFRNTKKEQHVNIIDFGCGDGVPMQSVFSYFNDFSNVRYIPIDISEDMLKKATDFVAKKFTKVAVSPILFDFEKGETLEELLSLTRIEGAQNFFFLLGNTLGNFDNTEKILSNIKLLMFSNDSLIIGNEVSNLLASPKLVEYYRTKEVFDLAITTLKTYGMDVSFDEFTVRWNNAQKQIETFATLNDSRKIVIAGQEVNFEKGEEISLFISKKFTEDSLMNIFNKVGFRIDLFTTNKKKNTCFVSVSPTRYKSK